MAGRLYDKVGPRPLLVLGLVLGALAMVWFAQLDPSSSYVGHVLPGLVVLGLGMGNIFAPGIYTVTAQGAAGFMSGPEPQQVTVEEGRVTEVTLTYDTGIR